MDVQIIGSNVRLESDAVRGFGPVRLIELDAVPRFAGLPNHLVEGHTWKHLRR